MSPLVAVMVADPAARAVAWPFVPAALLMAATEVVDELQVTEAVRSWVLASEKVPVAVNCWVVPTAILGFVGVTEMDWRVAVLTVRVVVPVLPPDVAVMVVVPAASPDALPTLSMVAVAMLDELQTTCVVKSWVLASEKVPVAVNCWVVPLAMLGLVGVTAMDWRVAVVTVRSVLPLLPPVVALMVVVPAAKADALPALSTVALVPSEVFQVTTLVRSLVLLSE
jgi:hypothetical protein